MEKKKHPEHGVESTVSRASLLGSNPVWGHDIDESICVAPFAHLENGEHLAFGSKGCKHKMGHLCKMLRIVLGMWQH